MNLSRVPGVEQCKVSYKKGKATVVFAADTEPDVAALKAAVSDLGFTPGEARVREPN